MTIDHAPPRQRRDAPGGIVCAADLAAEPWRNGGGVTRRIATGGSADRPDWTLSIADIDSACRFSPFPGMDRTAVVVGDDPVDLTINDTTRTLALLDRVTFAGEDIVSANPIRRPTRLLNLMTQRATCGGTLTLRHVRGMVDPGADDTVAWVVLAGHLIVDQQQVRRWDTVFLADLTSEIRGAATVAVIRLHPEETQ
ncbi:MAG: HutD family protein [Actinomycetota bacterium]|nr:HutD family protein [Actinomycetota bacterium]